MIRLNWFLPFLRKAKKGVTVDSPRLIERLARAVLPARCFSDRITGKPGLIRRGLKRVGESWLSSPWRRVVQGIYFVTFFWLFCYVCWPYTARPTGVWPGWVPIEIDASTGAATVSLATPLARPIATGSLIYAVDPSASPVAEPPSAVAFEVVAGGDQQLQLRPAEALSPERIEELSLSVTPWTLYEQRPGDWPTHYTDELQRKEQIAAETFLILDPLVSLSTAIAARSWVWSLTAALAILAVCMIVPRGFCGYLCPLGTLIDLFDWSIGKRVTRFRVSDDGWWVHVKYYVLLATLVAGLGGVLISGYVAAIPVITRGMLFVLGPLQTGMQRGVHLIPPWNSGHIVSLLLFVGVLALGLLKPRFWCKYVCPSGAVFSLGNLFRLSERKVESSCIHCNKCVEICPFDAIKPDFTTRTSDCTLCQSCGGVCPVHAIKFVDRFDFVDLKLLNDPPTHETLLGRRGFMATGVGLLAGSAGGVAAAVGVSAWGPNLDDPMTWRPVRPPGSVAEREFLQLCIRCGECFKACPNDVLQPLGFEQGLAGLWTPQVVADWAGCESSCNACTQVCPTGAIRPLPLDEKRAFHMGLAVVNAQTCLPIAGREACQHCVDECVSAGYHAIEFMQVRTEVDKSGKPIEGTGFLAPVVLAEKCVGCGLCQTRCYGINVIEKQLLEASAIVIKAGTT
jgi:ferredoxin